MSDENITEKQDLADEENQEIGFDEETNRKRKIFKTVVGICLVITSIFAIIGFKDGYFTDARKYNSLLEKLGFAAPIFYILLQAFLVTIPIVPAGVTHVAGLLAFGMIPGFLLNYIGLVLGSIDNFFLARIYGKKFVGLFMKEEKYKEKVNWLSNGGKIHKLLIFAFLVPFAPDDVSCMLAGMTDMKFKDFLLIILILKPVSIAGYLYILLKGTNYVYNILF